LCFSKRQGSSSVPPTLISTPMDSGRRTGRLLGHVHRSISLTAGKAFMPAGFVPERKLDPIPESELVVDDAKVVLHHMLGGSNDFGHVAIPESLGYEFDDLLLTRAGNARSVKAPSSYGRARF
jgi:hypothetical protein